MTSCLAAVHESGLGTKRRTAASTNSVAIGGTADMPRNRRARRSDAFDPSPTLAVHCGNGFAARFEPYQSTRLSRYNAAPKLRCRYATT
jgi:hypothetical protein